MTVSRNDPCPCGSGKKYKKCCGDPAKIGPPRGLDPNATSAKIQLLGLPGHAEHIGIINRFKDPDDPRNKVPLGGAPGLYKVTFILQRPGYPEKDEKHYAFEGGLKGNSHLGITKPAYEPPDPDVDKVLIAAATEDGQFTFRGYPNPAGFLGKIYSEPFQAQSRLDAERKAYRAIASPLSAWSLQLDVPLFVSQIETVELSTENTHMSLNTPFMEVPFRVNPTEALGREFRGYASLYREAMNTNSPVYRFLCFFKIAQAIIARRKHLERAAKRATAEFSRPEELIPSTDGDCIKWLAALFPVHRPWDDMTMDSILREEAIGKSITAVIHELTPLRDKIAHAFITDKEGLTLSVDELLHIEEVHKWLPLLKCMIRRMLRNEFPKDFLPYLKEYTA